MIIFNGRDGCHYIILYAIFLCFDLLHFRSYGIRHSAVLFLLIENPSVNAAVVADFMNRT